MSTTCDDPPVPGPGVRDLRTVAPDSRTGGETGAEEPAEPPRLRLAYAEPRDRQAVQDPRPEPPEPAGARARHPSSDPPGPGPRDLPALTRTVHRALLRNPSAAPEHLAALAGVGARELVARLDALCRDGLVRRVGERYLPVRPDSVAEDALRGEEAELDRRRDALLDARRALSARMDDWFAGQEAATGSIDIERVTGAAAVRARLAEVYAGARTEVLAVTTGPDDPEVAGAGTDRTAATARGVALRTIHPTRLRDRPEAWDRAREAAEAGEQVRLTDETPTRLLVRDRDVAVIPSDGGHDEGVHVVRSRPVVAAFVALFEQCWGHATPAFAPFDVSSDRDRRLLDLLAQGAKDETVARHLRLNVRTVRRAIACLTAELGAETRFQAGVKAARRGWV